MNKILRKIQGNFFKMFPGIRHFIKRHLSTSKCSNGAFLLHDRISRCLERCDTTLMATPSGYNYSCLTAIKVAYTLRCRRALSCFHEDVFYFLETKYIGVPFPNLSATFKRHIPQLLAWTKDHHYFSPLVTAINVFASPLHSLSHTLNTYMNSDMRVDMLQI